MKNNSINNRLSKLSTEKSIIINKLANHRKDTKNKKNKETILKYGEKYKTIIEKEKIEEFLRYSIEENIKLQKELIKSSKKIRKISPKDSNPDISKFSGKPGRRLYYFQELFSSEEDYFELEEEIKINFQSENELIKLIVINPELISDDFWVDSGLASENFLDKTFEEKLLEKNINIGELKKFLYNLVPLEDEKKMNSNTARILFIKNSKNNKSGKIILLGRQEGSKNNLKQKRTASFFNDLFSLYRSQKHTIINIEEKLKTLIMAKEYLKRILGNIESKNEFLLITLDNLSKEFKKFNGASFGYIVKYLGEIKLINIKKDKENVDKILKIIDWKISELKSQKNTIIDENIIIYKIIESSDVLWKNFIKNFHSFLNGLNQEKIQKTIEEFKKLEGNNLGEYRKIGVKNLSDKIKERIKEIGEINYDEEAKITAYYWDREDEKNNKFFSGIEHQNHQYFEALKQKKEYYKNAEELNKKDLNILENISNNFEQSEETKIFSTVISMISLHLTSFTQNNGNPYYKYCLKLNYELNKLKKAEKEKDIITYYRALLEINIIIKQYEIENFLLKLENSKEIEKIEKEDKLKQKYIGITRNQIKSLFSVQFLPKIQFEKGSNVSQLFIKYGKFLKSIEKYIEDGESKQLKIFIKNIKNEF